MNSFTLRVSGGRFSTTINISDGQRVARTEIFHPRNNRDGGIVPAKVNYPIMGDDSPEFAELMAYTLQRAAELARGLDREMANEIAKQKRETERDK